jgi:hypothetical protein
VKKEQYLCDTGRRYKALNFNLAPWDTVKTELAGIDWGQMQELAKTSPASALAEFHEKTLLVLEKLVPLKKKRPKGKPKMNRMRRLLWKRHAKVSKKFRTSQSIHKVSESMQKMWEIEKQLSAEAPSSVRKARESSLQVKGARHFNCIPRDLRDSSTGTPEQFKTKLDTWISTIPDQPTVPGRQRAAASNSLLEQVQTVLQN